MHAVLNSCGYNSFNFSVRVPPGYYIVLSVYCCNYHISSSLSAALNQITLSYKRESLPRLRRTTIRSDCSRSCFCAPQSGLKHTQGFLFFCWLADRLFLACVVYFWTGARPQRTLPELAETDGSLVFLPVLFYKPISTSRAEWMGLLHGSLYREKMLLFLCSWSKSMAFVKLTVNNRTTQFSFNWSFLKQQ